jgi:hypothetical protein
MPDKIWKRLAGSATLALAGLLSLGAVSAFAATEVEYNENVGGSEIEIEGEADADLVSVSLAGDTVTITDTGPGGIVRDPVDGTECTDVNPTTVTCPLVPPAPDRIVDGLDVDLDADNDTFTSSAPIEGSLNGEDGNDTIQGGPLDDNLQGGDGNDTLNGGDGNDFLGGGGGDFDSGGNDVLIGGNGQDEAGSGRDVPVTITLDGIANDGAASLGEVDNVQTEDFEGGSSDDVLIGDASSNSVQGFEGNDVIQGFGGPDALRGGQGDDQLDGGLGGGDDFRCGDGLDIALLDVGDTVTPGESNLGPCERTGAEVVGESVMVKGGGKASGKAKKGSAKVRVSCAAEEILACTGKVTLLSNGKKLTKKGSFNVAAGEQKNAKLKLTKKGAKKLRKAGGSLFVSAEAKTTYPNGTSIKAEQVQLVSGK